MKQTKRRLLSLLMAFAILCTMIPAAFAAETINWKEGEWTGGELTEEHTQHTAEQTPQSKTDPTCTATGTRTYKCTGCDATRIDTADALNHIADDTWHYEKKDATNHTKYHLCTRCNVKLDETTEVHTPDNTWVTDKDGHWHACKDCGEKLDYAAHRSTGTWVANDANHVQKCEICEYVMESQSHNWEWTERTETTHTGKCTVCGAEIKNETHNFVNGICTVCGKQNTQAIMSVKLTVGKTSIGVDEGASLTVTAYSDPDGKIVTSYDKDDVKYTVKDSKIVKISGNQVIGLRPGETQIQASVGGQNSDWVTITVKASKDLEVTISQSMETYTFGDSDTLKGDSLYEQLDDALEDIASYKYYEDLTFSISGGTSTVGTIDDGKLTRVKDFDDVEFTIKKTGTFTANYTISEKDTTVLSGKIIINVEEGPASAGDIIYTAISNKDVALDVKDFEEFWENTYSKGTLKYVIFEKVSSTYGSLEDEDGDRVSTDECYVDPTSKQIDLDGVTFVPKKSFTGPVSIGFTAYGTTSSSSRSTKPLKGTLTILYTESEPKAITYSVTNKPVTLDGDDFLANYKDAMGTSAKTLQIKFLDVPTYGTLYYKYNEKTERGTELTKKNIDSYLFSTNSKASGKSLADVTYVPDSKGRSDTVKFACYDSSSKLCYYGEVTFGVTVKEVTVSLSSTSAGVTFNSADFFGASEDMLAVTYLTFGTPSNGTLYKNWTGINGTRVSSTDKFSYVASVTGYTSIGTVTYVPTAGYSGTVTIPFSAYTASGTVINGTVSIKVTATSTVIFTDVPTTGPQSWAYPYINRLASAGVVGGVTPTTYGPKQQVKWGEVLKMVLLGAGHPAQTEGTGANWAANYLTYAYQKGIVNSNKIDISKPITRVEMAELAAKALGLSPETSIKTGIIGPTDTTNGYVYALYNRGIVGGDSSSGKNLYNPNSTLLRDEMAKIVCGVMDNAK